MAAQMGTHDIFAMRDLQIPLLLLLLSTPVGKKTAPGPVDPHEVRWGT